MEKQFDIILCTDEETEGIFKNMMKELADVTGNNSWMMSGQPPHISLGIFDIIDNTDPVSILEPVMRGFQRFSLMFDTLAAFPPHILFAAPAIREELIYMNREVHKVADTFFQPHEQYIYSRWVPHLTLISDLKQNELDVAFAYACKHMHTITAQMVSVSLVHHFPYVEELVLPLK